MKYRYVRHAVTPDGWGICGVFPASVVEEAEERQPHGCLIISSEHIIVGIGPGWDSEGIMDDDWLERACEALNERDRD